MCVLDVFNFTIAILQLFMCVFKFHFCVDLNRDCFLIIKDCFKLSRKRCVKLSARKVFCVFHCFFLFSFLIGVFFIVQGDF